MPDLHSAPPPTPAPSGALRRAVGAAKDIAGAYADTPAGFWPLSGRASALVRRAGAPGQTGGTWVLVTCRSSGEPGHAAHLRERSLTAAQRFALSLWLDGLDAVWTAEGVPDGDAFRAAGLAIGAAEPVGLVWVPDA
ncbi:MAG TPA: hypothetical protein VGB53_08200 [Rubricoccaceae bacterium]